MVWGANTSHTGSRGRGSPQERHSPAGAQVMLQQRPCSPVTMDLTGLLGRLWETAAESPWEAPGLSGCVVRALTEAAICLGGAVLGSA